MLEESNTLDYIKIRSFSIKVIIWTVNRQPMDKKKIFARQTHLVLLWLALLYFADTVFLFFFTKRSFMATLTQARWLAPFFSNSICSFGISGLLLTDFCRKLYYYMCFDISDQWCLELLLQKYYNLLKPQVMVSIFSNKHFKLRYGYCFLRPNVIAHLMEDSMTMV